MVSLGVRKLKEKEAKMITKSINQIADQYDRIWKLHFRNSLKNYVVKQYGRWSEYWAPDKTSLRTAIYGRIDKIVEVA